MQTPSTPSDSTSRDQREPGTVTDAGNDPASVRPISSVALFSIGMGAALLGLLPWLVTGMRLPLQNLWAEATLPTDMPLALMPFSQYLITLIVSVLIVGAGVAGLTARMLGARVSRRGTGALLCGVLLIQTIAITQSAIVVGFGLRSDNWAAFYLTALVLVAALSIAIGAGILLLIARARVPGAAIALSIVAVELGTWLGRLVVSIFTPAVLYFDDTTQRNLFAEGMGISEVLLAAVRWTPAILIGVIIAWCGFRTVGRVIASVTGLLILWVGPALVTAISAAAGTRVLARHPGDMVEYGAGVFVLVLKEPNLSLLPLLVAAGVGIVGAVVVALVRPKRSTTHVGE